MAQADTGPLALLGGSPVRPADKAWPKWPVVTETERRAVNEVLESGRWWYGDRVAQFEQEYARHHGAAHCISCNSGTAALEICLQALGIGPGDEIIVPAYTFVATASAVARVGATPVFVDVDETWCIDPAAAEAAITPRTRAIVPVHFGSCIADMDEINALAAARGLAVVEDACHSWGAQYKGKGTGVLGRCGVFSFQMSKNLTAGEGGAILTDDESLAETCRAITNCGRVKNGAWYGHEVIGTNARMNEFQAALLLAQLERLEPDRILRERNAARLDAVLADIDGLTPQPGRPGTTRRTYHLYPMTLDPDRFGCTRERFLEAARAEGFGMAPGYPVPLYAQPVFARMPQSRPHPCPVTEDLCASRGLWFTHYFLLGSEDDIDDIGRIFRKIKAHAADL